MRLVMQRVKRASVTVDERTVGEIGRGLLVLVGIGDTDTEADADWCVQRIVKTQLWPEHPGAAREDEGRPWKHSVESAALDVLCVSQFTLYGTLKKKKKGQLDFHHAMGGDAARAFYGDFLRRLRLSLPDGAALADGEFGARMDVALVNDGPVTLTLDSRVGNGLNPVEPPPPPQSVEPPTPPASAP